MSGYAPERDVAVGEGAEIFGREGGRGGRGGDFVVEENGEQALVEGLGDDAAGVEVEPRLVGHEGGTRRDVFVVGERAACLDGGGAGGEEQADGFAEGQGIGLAGDGADDGDARAGIDPLFPLRVELGLQAVGAGVLDFEQAVGKSLRGRSGVLGGDGEGLLKDLVFGRVA